MVLRVDAPPIVVPLAGAPLVVVGAPPIERALVAGEPLALPPT